jgi:hypothetical protein
MEKHIVGATAGRDRLIHVRFSDLTTKVVDVAPLLSGPAFAILRDDDRSFRALHVDPVLRTVCWPGELDLAPETLAALPDVGVSA